MLIPRDNLIIPSSGSIPVTLEEALQTIENFKDEYAVQGNYIIALLRQAQSIRNEILVHLSENSDVGPAELQSWKTYLEYEPVDGHEMPRYQIWLMNQ